MAAPNLTRIDARSRAELLDVTAYDVELDLTDGAGKPGWRTFRSRTTVRFRARGVGAGTFVDLVADRIRSATLNGRLLDIANYAPESGLQLPALAEDNTLVVDADCMYSNTGEGLHRFVDPVDSAVYLYSQFETADAKRMYTCFDQPDLKATFTLTVTAPTDWEVVSNGRPAARTDGPGGAQVVRFTTTPPLSTYVTALVAGPYHKVADRHDGIDLGVYCRASLAQYLDADEIFAVTKQGFDWYHQAFGYRYAFDKFDQLFVPEFNAGAMENAGCVTFQEDNVFRSKVTEAAYERRAETILHELAHMWFGDTSLADLLRALEQESGRDLSTWSAQWLESAGINSLRADFTLDDQGRYASFAIRQGPAEPGSTLRNHRLAIGRYEIDDGKVVRVGRTEVDVTGERTQVPELVGVSPPALLLVNDDDLTYGKIR